MPRPSDILRNTFSTEKSRTPLRKSGVGGVYFGLIVSFISLGGIQRDGGMYRTEDAWCGLLFEGVLCLLVSARQQIYLIKDVLTE